jgi:GTPase SAR1 family protein
VPSAYKSKIITIGSSSSGKDNFFKSCDQIFNSCCNTSYWTIGLSIKVAEYSNDQSDTNLTLALWDINPSERFRFLFSNFFKGAAAAIIFLDYSANHSFEDLKFWLDIIRDSSNYIPIFLVGIDNEIQYRKYFREIINFVENNRLDGLYFISTFKKMKNSIILTQLSKKILNNIRSNQNILSINGNLKEVKLLGFNKFASFFSCCPLCGAENHKSYLSKFYFDNNEMNKRLKDYLIMLMERHERFDSVYENEIKIGIPCCKCFNKIF